MGQPERSVAGEGDRLCRHGSGQPAVSRCVLWSMRTGANWRDLPDEYARWHTVSMRFSRWAEKGRWQRVADTIAADPDFEWVPINSTLVRAQQHAAGAKGAAESSVRTLTRWPLHDNPHAGGCVVQSNEISADGGTGG